MNFGAMLAMLMAAVLLLGAPASASKVLCVSPEGHHEVEDWGSDCCVPMPRPDGAGFAAPTLCQGCTDYELSAAAEASSAQEQPAGFSCLGPNPWTDPGAPATAGDYSGYPPRIQGVPPPLLTSLRC
jgi:hypothetical protein